MHLDDVKSWLTPLIEEDAVCNRYTPKEEEILYSSAYSFYNQGKYEKSAQLFTHLLVQNPYEPRFWKGLGSSSQMLKNYKAALHAWGIYALTSNHEVSGHFHAAECLLSLGEIQEARKAIALAKQAIQSNDPFEKKIEFIEQQVKNYG